MGHAVRRLVAALLAFVAAALTVTAVTAAWTSGTALNTPTFVARVGPVIDDPTVRAAVATQLADQLVAALDRQRASGNLPASLALAVQQLGPRLDSAVRAQLAGLVSSANFRALWYDALAVVHRQAVALLTGAPSAARVVAGRVDVDLVALMPPVLAYLQRQLPGAFGTGISAVFPTGSPAQLRREVASVLGVGLPADFGMVAVMDAAQLDRARFGAQLLVSAAPRAALTAVVALLAGLLISPRVTRTAAQAALWTCALAGLAYLAVRWVVSSLLAGVANPPLRPALDAAASRVLGSLGTWVATTIAGAALLAVALFMASRRGPGRRPDGPRT